MLFLSIKDQFRVYNLVTIHVDASWKSRHDMMQTILPHGERAGGQNVVTRSKCMRQVKQGTKRAHIRTTMASVHRI